MTHTALLGLLAETSIHAGAGQMAGVIDLPIQREAHTEWPVVFGSSVKGALRTLADEQQASWRFAVFGPETSNASDHAGALLVSDARLLLLPVRSLTSHFKWVTCPALLNRLKADIKRLQLSDADFVIPEFDNDKKEIALVANAATGALFLEEFKFTAKAADLDTLIKILARLMDRDDAVAALKQQLVIVHDDRFKHMAKFATPVNAHVCIDNKTKTVKPGALWYEESLPADTVLYVGLHAQATRTEKEKKTAGEVLSHITDELFSRPYLQLGGNETVGMGWCKVAICKAGS
ncbi:MAG: type III-B CRISPR module RAMP protein Cmr4 [Candidatus Competibacteraceae bacterium]|nr:MAG: type III-B CRISPR module RAMP protein Cmr4 [Candidatus Competibacteraceae bacterium]